MKNRMFSLIVAFAIVQESSVIAALKAPMTVAQEAAMLAAITPTNAAVAAKIVTKHGFTLASASLDTTGSSGQQSQPLSIIPPSSLPDSLPIGNLDKMLDYMVSNAAYPDFRLSFSTTTNSYQYYERTYGGVLKFDSYASFEQCMMTNCWYVYTNFIASRTDVTSPIGLTVIVNYDPVILNSGLIILTNNVGYVGSITSNSFLGITNAFNRLRPPVIVSGLSQFKVTVDVNPPYSYTWTASGQNSPKVIGGYPIEWTTNGVVILNQWYGMGQYRARFTITANGQTRTYTQSGSPLQGAELSMTSRSNLLVSMTSGSDTYIEASTNLTDWTTVTNFPWQFTGMTNCTSIIIDPDLPEQFFRARSE
ncbi:MAG: hypothetical protein KGI49_00120 [Patescibacteria group bacterium]|nr:hypothetical protein [Patescibacteria group bacterium]